MFTNRDGKWWPINPDISKKVKMRIKKKSDLYRDLSRFFHPLHVEMTPGMREMRRLWESTWHKT